MLLENDGTAARDKHASQLERASDTGGSSSDTWADDGGYGHVLSTYYPPLFQRFLFVEV